MEKNNRMHALTGLLSVAAILGGCAVGPVQKPEWPEPANSIYAPRQDLVAMPADIPIGNATLHKAVRPSVPFSAAWRHQQGKVVVSFTVTPWGRAVDMKVEHSDLPGVFDDEALKALWNSTFYPAETNCRPVAERGEITYFFDGATVPNIGKVSSLVMSHRPAAPMPLFTRKELASAQEWIAARRKSQEAHVDRSNDVKIIHSIAPVWPAAALRMGIEGVVELKFVVTAKGRPTQVRIAYSNPPGVFDESAMAALKKWQFKPRLIDGKPVDRNACQSIQYQINWGRRPGL